MQRQSSCSSGSLRQKATARPTIDNNQQSALFSGTVGQFTFENCQFGVEDGDDEYDNDYDHDDKLQQLDLDHHHHQQQSVVLDDDDGEWWTAAPTLQHVDDNDDEFGEHDYTGYASDNDDDDNDDDEQHQRKRARAAAAGLELEDDNAQQHGAHDGHTGIM